MKKIKLSKKAIVGVCFVVACIGITGNAFAIMRPSSSSCSDICRKIYNNCANNAAGNLDSQKLCSKNLNKCINDCK